MRWPLILLLALLPLQWFVVVGPLRLHLVAMLTVLAVVVATHRASAFSPVLRLAGAFVVANLVLCVVWIGANLYHGTGLRQPLQQLSYLGVFLVVGTLVRRGLAEDDRSAWVSTMRWTSLAVNATFLGALSFSMAHNGVNPGVVLADTLSSADPEILQKELFRSAFAGFGFDQDVVRGNFRHEIFGAVLLGMSVSAACAALRPFRSPAASALYRFSLAVGAVLILVSMSRSVMIAAAVWPLLLILRAARDPRRWPRLVGGLSLTALLAVVVAATGLGEVLWVRFTQDTGSYKARDHLLELARQNILDNTVTGGLTTAGASSHNFVLDTWLRAGIFAALAALVVVVLLLGLMLSMCVGLHREPAWMVAVTSMLALPVVRMFTAGGGLVPPVSWVALGVAAGFLVHRQRLLTLARRDRVGGSGASAVTLKRGSPPPPTVL